MQRKRFIKILALGTGASALGIGSTLHKASALGANTPYPIQWKGFLLGSNGAMQLFAKDPTHAKKTLQSVFKEIQRLEQKFSLYLANSEINTLNQSKVLKQPDSDWLKLCETIDTVHALTRGYFDPAVQSLWHYHSQQPEKDLKSLEDRLPEIGWQHISYSKSEIRIHRQECQLTLNGVAQGYITDRATDILRNEGFDKALIQLGETKALGQHPDKRPFQIGIQKPNERVIAYQLELDNQALATSSSYGSYIHSEEKLGHILNPKTGKTLHESKTISVLTHSAAIADALATGLLLLNDSELNNFIEINPQFTIIRS